MGPDIVTRTQSLLLLGYSLQPCQKGAQDRVLRLPLLEGWLSCSSFPALQNTHTSQPGPSDYGLLEPYSALLTGQSGGEIIKLIP